MTKVFSFISILLLINIFFSDTIIASMDPVEIEKLNSEASFHITGKVTSDELYRDISAEQELTYQIRKMTIDIDEILKKPSTVNEDEISIEVYYSYIPSWLEYVGGKRMDITVNDVIEVWLEDGETGWEPVLSGDSVNHIEYVKKRNEPISEPILHFFKRILESNIQSNGNGIVITGIFLSIIGLFYIGLKKK
ncbi:MAG: hypothetical protein ACE3JQ_02655 [Paenisporosarcina sp.]